MSLLLNIFSNTVIPMGALWGVVFVLMAFFVWGIFYQRRLGRDLRYELGQLDRLKENNVESEFVLRAMRLATWHLAPQDMVITYDSDFRDKDDADNAMLENINAADLMQRVHPQDQEQLSRQVAELCEGRTENYHVEYRLYMPHSKSYAWQESYATIVERDVAGRPRSIVGTTMRIDSRKNMEQALIEARNRAEESDRMKSAFIANMSHEIRTPLNAIVGFTSVLPDISEAAERQQLLDLIHENTQKLLRIIDDVVNISKIESGQEQIVLTAFDVNLVLMEYVEKFRKEVASGVEIDTMFASEQLMITTDLGRFAEIIKHLVQNAVKFTPQGRVVVGYDLPRDGRLSVWVRDTGIGIAPEHHERIFERFYKIDEFVPGAGLGLSICRAMAFSLGGTVTCQSKLGEGATFTVDIPAQ